MHLAVIKRSALKTLGDIPASIARTQRTYSSALERHSASSGRIRIGRIITGFKLNYSIGIDRKGHFTDNQRLLPFQAAFSTVAPARGPVDMEQSSQPLRYVDVSSTAAMSN